MLISSLEDDRPDEHWKTAKHKRPAEHPACLLLHRHRQLHRRGRGEAGLTPVSLPCEAPETPGGSGQPKPGRQGQGAMRTGRSLLTATESHSPVAAQHAAPWTPPVRTTTPGMQRGAPVLSVGTLGRIPSAGADGRGQSAPHLLCRQGKPDATPPLCICSPLS